MNLRIFIYLAISLLGISQMALSQDFSYLDKYNSTYGFKNISTEEGLSQNSIIDIAKDSLGFMWFATVDGLNRFDGNIFKTYPKLFDLEISEDYSNLGQIQVFGNTLWLITKGGNLEKMDLLTEKFEDIIIPYKNFPPARTFLVESDNRIWYGSQNNGVYLLNAQFDIVNHYSTKGTGNSRLVSNTINRIFKDSFGTMWILTNKGVHEITGEGNYIHLKNSNTTAIAESGTRSIFLGTKGDGLFGKDFNGGNLIPFRTNRSNVLNNILIEDIVEKDFKLWIGTYNKGIFVVDLGMGDVSNFMPNSHSPSSIGSNNVTTIFSDNEGSTWVGMDKGGVSLFNDQYKYFNNLQLEKGDRGLNQEVGPIVSDTLNNLWFITNDFFLNKYNFQTDSLQIYDLRIILEEEKVKATALIFTEKGLLISMEKGGLKLLQETATRIEFKKNESAHYFNDSKKVTTFLDYGQQGILGGTDSATVLLLDKNLRVKKEYYCKECKGDKISALEKINDSTIAVGYKNMGLRLLNIKNGFYCTITNSKNECLKSLTINTLYYINDWLWAGTYGKGIWGINLKDGRVKTFTNKDGLPSNIIYGIIPEDSRQLWASTNKGLFKLTYKKFNQEVEIDKIQQFTLENGLRNNEFSPNSFHLSPQKTLVFGGSKGLDFFKAGTKKALDQETKVYISEVLVENQSISGHLALQNINLPFLNNSFALNYSALDFLTPSQHIFSYRLKGFDEDWIEAGKRKYVAYNNLPPGDYSFQVKLSEKNLDYAPITSLGVYVETPFWYTWWFIVIAVISFFLLIYIFYRYRLERIMELQKIKDRISADLHDDLGSRLTTVHFISAISRKKHHGSPDVFNILSKIDREIYASSEALDEIVWNIRRADESFGEIIAKIRRYISDVLEAEEIRYDIKIKEDVESNQFSMENKKEIFLICKELINNVRKHSGATYVLFKIKNSHHSMSIFIKDNGKGFDPARITHRNGLSNIKKRVLKWNGTYMINSEVGKGTMIVINFPLKKTNSILNFLKKLFYISPKKGIEPQKELV